jgi:hypothetical protein
MLDEVRLSAGAGTFNWMANVSVTAPALAVSVAVCALATGVAYALNWTLDRFALINPAGDTVTAALLLDKATLRPAAGAGPLMVAVQRSVAVPPSDALAQDRPVSTGKPVPLSETTAVLFVVELLVRVNCPVSAPSAVGSNSTPTVAVWPGVKVIGNVPAASVKPAPLTVAPLMVTGAVPVELRVIDWVVGVFTPALAKVMLDEVRLSAGAGTFNWMANVSVTPPALAVSVAVCALATGVAYALNWTLDRFALTNPAGDTVTAALLLDKATLRPAAGAGPLMVAVQRSVAVPPIEALVQDRPLNCGVVAAAAASAAPVPARAICVGEVEASLLMLSCPVSCPAEDGTKLTLTLSVPPAGIETGTAVCRATENEFPVTLICVTFTAAEPILATDTVALVALPTGMLPRFTDAGDATRLVISAPCTTVPMHPVSSIHIEPTKVAIHGVARSRSMIWDSPFHETRRSSTARGIFAIGR